jgi:hypothetical protein
MESPPCLYRAFSKKEYAEDFIVGKIRFGSLNYYRRIERDPRQDTTEGIGKARYKSNISSVKIDKQSGESLEFEQPGLMNLKTNSPNSMYILSLSGSDIDLEYLSNKFGRYIVKISQLEKFKEDLNKAFPLRIFPIQFEKVQYNKGFVVDIPEDDLSFYLKLSYAQKPEEYSQEKEYRYVAIVKEPILDEDGNNILDSKQHIPIDIGKRLAYVDLLK